MSESNTNHWTDEHITTQEWMGVTMYYGWDETGADTVCVSTKRHEVVKALEEYSKRLERT